MNRHFPGTVELALGCFRQQRYHQVFQCDNANAKLHDFSIGQRGYPGPWLVGNGFFLWTEGARAAFGIPGRERPLLLSRAIYVFWLVVCHKNPFRQCEGFIVRQYPAPADVTLGSQFNSAMTALWRMSSADIRYFPKKFVRVCWHDTADRGVLSLRRSGLLSQLTNVMNRQNVPCGFEEIGRALRHAR